MTAPSGGNWESYAPTPSTPASSKPRDIWGLGNLYNQPVYLGVTESGTGRARVASNGQDLIPGQFGGAQSYTNQFGQTQDLLNQVAKMWASDPASYMALQQQLADAGYYGEKGKFTPGRFDDNTQSAVKNALKDYEKAAIGGQTPVTFAEFVQKNAVATKAATSAQPQQQVTLDDPAAIRAAAQQAFETSLGRAATENELSSFVAQFQAAQRSAETSTGSAVATPNLVSQAAQFAQSAAPGEYQAHNREGYVNAIANLFLPAESQRPSITPVPQGGVG